MVGVLMDLSDPIRSVMPSAHAHVLGVLARTDRPLTGRQVAELTDGAVSQKGTNLVLRALVEAGIVTVEDHPPAKLYTLNRQHLAAAAIESLASLRSRLIEKMQQLLATWATPAWGAWLFGSAARGDGGVGSDIDVLVVRSDTVDGSDASWIAQVDDFAAAVTSWTGNSCEIVEFGRDEFENLFARQDRLATELSADGVALTERRLPRRPIEARPRR